MITGVVTADREAVIRLTVRGPAQEHKVDTAPLVGMSLLAGYELTIQVRTGGSVTIKALRQQRGG